nr:uncharacterized protein LOC123751374 [Procambarus clarkii]
MSGHPVASSHAAGGKETKRPKARDGCRRSSSGGRGAPGGGRGGGGAGGHGRTGAANETCPVIRLLVLGGHGVGKSAVAVRYLTRRYIGEYKSQVDIIYRQSLQLDGMKVDLEIIDISRPGEASLPVLEMGQCDGYLVVYSVAHKHTFLTANRLLHAIYKLRPHLPRPPITLLGNKQDLEHSREVTADEGRTSSTIFGCAFAEVSVAETSEDIVPIFTSLIRRARASCCKCPTIFPALLDPTVCACSCRQALRLDGYTCRLCCTSGSSRIPCMCNGSSGSCGSRNGKVPGRCMYGGPHRGRRQEDERAGRKVSRSGSKKLRERSFSSPLYVCENTASVRSVNCQRDSLSPSPSRTRAAGGRKLSGRETQNTQNDKTQHYTHSGPVRANLSRSLSSPEAWPDSWPVELPSLFGPNTGSGKGSKREGLIATIKEQEPSLSLLARGRSLVQDTHTRVKHRECSCKSRTQTFKSSGKVEIVNIKKPDGRLTIQDEGGRNQSGSLVGPSPQPDKWPAKLPAVKICNNTSSSSSSTQPKHTAATNEHCASPSSLSTGCPRSPKRFPFDSLETRRVEDDSPSPQGGGRQRKFSVFGVGRALGHFLSKGSLPDLPRATANICDKFGSLKRTIKKRSV